jgi:hypothetical protein
VLEVRLVFDVVFGGEEHTMLTHKIRDITLDNAGQRERQATTDIKQKEIRV